MESEAVVAADARGIGRPFAWFYLRVIWPLATVLLLVAGTVMLWEAIDRTLNSHSYIWSEETIRYGLLWAAFMGFGLAGVHRQHLRSDLILRLMPRRMAHVAGMLGDLAGLVFCTLLLAGSIVQLNQLFDTGMLSEAFFEIPMWKVYVIVPIGATLFGTYYLLSLTGQIPREATGSPDDVQPID